MKLLNFDRIICLSPHPDDVEYSISATIKKHNETIFDILCLSYGGSTDMSSSVVRIEEVKHFWAAFEAKNVNLIFPEHFSLDDLNESQLITYIENTIIKINTYQGIIVPSAEDSHSEHRLVSGIASALTRNKVISIFEYKCSSSLHNWIPNFFIDIDDICSKKIDLLQSNFKSQIDSFYFKKTNLELFHRDFISDKKVEAQRESLKIRILYI